MSLKVRKDWLAAPVSMYARRPRRKRPSATKPEQFVRSLGRHGSHHLIEVLHRGKRVLRYVREDLLNKICEVAHKSIATPATIYGVGITRTG